MEKEHKILSSVKEKPYFLQGNFVLYNDDCLKILEQLPENSVDMIFADPPYNLSNGGFSVHAGKRVSVNKGSWDKSKVNQPVFPMVTLKLDDNLQIKFHYKPVLEIVKHK